MLDRYRKSGGFIQLLNLLETCGTQKQEKFMTMIREEDPRWAETLEKKMLSLPRIFSWPHEAIAEVAGNLNELTIIVAFHGLDQAQREKILKTFDNFRRHRIEDLFSSRSPLPSEIQTMLAKVIAEVRKMITEGRLRMDKFDPPLVIEDDIEMHLEKAEEDATALAMIASESNIIHLKNACEAEAHAKAGSHNHRDDVASLKKVISSLTHENAALKNEVSHLRIKLEQIKKIV